MPRDQRLYMTFPNDFPWHPKISRLPSASAKWAFVEMNGYSRMNDLDGVIPVEDAAFMWEAEDIDALLRSHPTRPLVLRDGDNYVIRDYAEHQQTKAQREDLTSKRSEAGRKGGLAKSQASASKSQANPGKPKQSQSQSQRTTTYDSESQSLDNRANESTDEQSAEPYKSVLASQYGIDVEKVRRHLDEKLGLMLEPPDVVNVSMWILNKIPQPPRAPTSYVIGSITKSPAEVQQYIHESALV